MLKKTWESLGQWGDQTSQSWIFIGGTNAKAEAPVFWPPDIKSWLTGKDPDAEKDWGQEKKGATEDEMVGWFHWLNGHEFEQTLGDSEGQESLACCSPWGRKESENLVTENKCYWFSASFLCLLALYISLVKKSLFKSFVYFLMVVLGLHCCTQAFSSCSERGLLSIWDVWTSLYCGFSCSEARALDT